MALERNVRTVHMMERDKKTPQDRMALINHELGQLGYEFLQAGIFKNETKEHLANARLELADALLQVNILCLDLGYNPDEILNLGVQHAFERFKEFDARGWGKKDQESSANPIVNIGMSPQGLFEEIIELSQKRVELNSLQQPELKVTNLHSPPGPFFDFLQKLLPEIYSPSVNPETCRSDEREEAYLNLIGINPHEVLRRAGCARCNNGQEPNSGCHSPDKRDPGRGRSTMQENQ